MAQVRGLASASPDAGAARRPRSARGRRARDHRLGPEFADRWVEHVMDALHVPRIDVQSEATLLRDQRARCRRRHRRRRAGRLRARQRPATAAPGDEPFTMLDLAALGASRSTICRRSTAAQLFSMVAPPDPGRERAAGRGRARAPRGLRRHLRLRLPPPRHRLPRLPQHERLGHRQRRPGARPPLAGARPLRDRRLRGRTGVEPERAHAAFRVDGFVADPFGGGGGASPVGLVAGLRPLPPGGLAPDPAEVDGASASLTGNRSPSSSSSRRSRAASTAWPSGGLVVGEDGTIANPDAAMAYLVAARSSRVSGAR